MKKDQKSDRGGDEKTERMRNERIRKEERMRDSIRKERG